VEFRRLGRSGLTISEIAYGNWLTHGSQVEEDAAHAFVQAALDVGITTFDTADVYAGTRAESVLGRALAGQRREGLEIFTKVYWPTGPGQNDRGLSRKHITESCHASLKRLQTDYVDLYQAHRYDETVPLEETMTAFADLVRAGKVLYIGVSEWRADEIAAAAGFARDLGIQLISNQPQYSMLWRVIEDEVVPTCEQEGLSQIVWSPLAQGVLTGKYQPGQQPPDDSRAAHPTQVSRCATCSPTRSSPRSSSCARSPMSWGCRWRSWGSRGCCRTPTWPRPSSGPPAPSRCWTTSRRRASGSTPRS
jgi:aryl-alcohol dehydrogenase-like predicted oxidoreductase